MILSTQSGYISAVAAWTRLRLMQRELSVFAGCIILQVGFKNKLTRMRVGNTSSTAARACSNSLAFAAFSAFFFAFSASLAAFFSALFVGPSPSSSLGSQFRRDRLEAVYAHFSELPSVAPLVTLNWQTWLGMEKNDRTFLYLNA